MFALQLVYLRTSRQMRYLDLEAKTPLYSQLSETIAGLEHIRGFGWEEKTLEESFRLLDYSQKPYYYLFCIQRWLLLVLDFVGSAAAIILVSIAVFLTFSTTQPSIGLSMVGTMFLSLVLRNWVRNWTQLETALGAVKRLRTFEQETPVERDKAGAQDIPEWPSRGTLEFKNVTAKYRYAPVSPLFAINANERIAAPMPKAQCWKTSPSQLKLERKTASSAAREGKQTWFTPIDNASLTNNACPQRKE